MRRYVICYYHSWEVKYPVEVLVCFIFEYIVKQLPDDFLYGKTNSEV